MEDRNRNMNSHVATGSVDPHLGNGSGVPDSASVVRNKEESKTRREKKRKDEDQDSEEGRSYTSTALALPAAGVAFRAPHPATRASELGRKATLVKMILG